LQQIFSGQKKGPLAFDGVGFYPRRPIRRAQNQKNVGYNSPGMQRIKEKAKH
jgi:hypothetical protein